jgi:hypothetical protein
MREGVARERIRMRANGGRQRGQCPWSARAVACARNIVRQSRAYPLTFCTTCGDDLSSEEGEADTVTEVHKGREIKLCKGCVKIFTADPDGYLKQVDKAIKDGKPTRSGHGAPKQ